MLVHSNYSTTKNINPLISLQIYFIFRADVPDVYAARWVLIGSLSICTLKAMVFCQETQAMCENSLLSSHQFMEHLKQKTQSSDRLVQMPTKEQDGLRNTASSKQGTFGAQMYGGLGGAPFEV